MFNTEYLKPSWIKSKEKAKDLEKEKELQAQAVAPINIGEDGTHVIDTTNINMNGYASVPLQASMNSNKMLIDEYRQMSMDSDVDNAIDEIINAAITCDDDEYPVVLNLDEVDMSDSIKTKILDEFNHILNLFDIKRTGYEKLRQFYVDGRTAYQLIVDEKNPTKGIKKIVHLDSRTIRRVKEVKKEYKANGMVNIVDSKEYFIYNSNLTADPSNVATVSSPSSFYSQSSFKMSNQSMMIDVNAVVYVHCGIQSSDGSLVYSYLDKARKPLNNLKAMRDAGVIYRIARSSEKRAFFVDTGSLPPKASHAYMQDVISKNKTEILYDNATGSIRSNSATQSILQDIWLPRREGSRGTEVSFISGGSNLGQIDDILYFERILFRALNVPMPRMQEDNSAILLGGQGDQITNSEWKFNKFICRLRNRFNDVFNQTLRAQLDLKGIMTKAEFDEILGDDIKYIYTVDSYIKNQQEDQKINNRLTAVGMADAFVGKYFSKDWVRRNCLKQDDKTIKAESEKIKKEADEDGNTLPLENPLSDEY